MKDFVGLHQIMDQLRMSLMGMLTVTLNPSLKRISKST